MRWLTSLLRRESRSRQDQDKDKQTVRQRQREYATRIARLEAQLAVQERGRER